MIHISECVKDVYQNREKKFLCIDIDDTLLNTESALIKSLGITVSSVCRESYDFMDSLSPEGVFIAKEFFSDYSKIPFIVGARESLELLKDSYNVILYSVYCNDYEYRAKKLFAKSLGVPAVLVHSKDEYSLKGCIFIDDTTHNLNISDAEEKICFFKLSSFWEDFSGKVVFDWFTLTEELLH